MLMSRPVARRRGPLSRPLTGSRRPATNNPSTKLPTIRARSRKQGGPATCPQVLRGGSGIDVLGLPVGALAGPLAGAVGLELECNVPHESRPDNENFEGLGRRQVARGGLAE